MLAFLLASSLSHAQEDEPVDVFVAPLEGEGAAAELVEGFLNRAVGEAPGLFLIPLERAPQVFDTSAALYLEACPPGQVVGCAWVVADAASAELAVAGTVQERGGVVQLDVTVIDVSRSVELVTHSFELQGGSVEAFARGVADVVVEVLLAERGPDVDIRATVEEEPEVDRDRVAARLAELQAQLGELTLVTQRPDRAIAPPEFTLEDLSRAMDSDATKDWERLGMTPAEYLRYRNSGLSLGDWQARAAGRRGQLLLRPLVGFGRGPSSSSYQGRLAYEAGTDGFDLAEAYAVQSVAGAPGARFGGSVSYGVLAWLDVGLVLGGVTGRMTIDILSQTVGQDPGVERPEDFPVTSLFVGPRMVLAPLPVSRVRPLVGADLQLWRGTAVDQVKLPPDDLPTFKASSVVLVSALLGVEATVSQALDVYALLPLSAVVAGTQPQVFETGGGVFTDRPVAADVSGVAAALEVGLQVRLFGARAERTKPRDVR